jgi:2-haloacid dehalogenase
MLEAAVKSAALDVLLDDVISVDAVRKYKTSPSAYELITMQWRLYPSAISFQSSNRWDVAGAVKFGMRGVWVNRSNQPDEYRAFPPALILPSLQLLD